MADQISAAEGTDTHAGLLQGADGLNVGKRTEVGTSYSLPVFD